jgi:hypothetical protein
VTGLEIADGEIRLVRWPGNIREIRGSDPGIDPARRILARETLEDIFAAVTGAERAIPAIEEVEVRSG